MVTNASRSHAFRSGFTRLMLPVWKGNELDLVAGDRGEPT